ncbi:MAG: hypothetical protein U5R31_04675 [Acidimicrobiia bacterium]|nr:hypothetical protein [Acidimicrobiia bacterium]
MVDLSDDIGCRGLLIHADTEHARDFYLHLVPESMSSPTDELHLVLLRKDAWPNPARLTPSTRAQGQGHAAPTPHSELRSTLRIRSRASALASDTLAPHRRPGRPLLVRGNRLTEL